jgi:hypothetical protein
MILKNNFTTSWKKYFDGAEEPIVFWYTDEEAKVRTAKSVPPDAHRCFIGDLAQVRKGRPVKFSADAVGCEGGKRYLGFSSRLRPNFEYFLSYGIPGELQGERYKKTPNLVNEALKRQPGFIAPGRFIVFKPWSMIENEDKPAVVIFFALPDVLSGLFTLSNYDEEDPNSIICPFGAGCSTIVQYPYAEGMSDHPRGVIGMLDVSARPCVPAGVITFAVPMNKFVRMVANMEESFLITDSWRKVKRRITSTLKPQENSR